MKYAYSSSHNVSFGKYFRKKYKTFINSFNNASAREIKVPVSSCFIVGCGHSGTTLTAAKLGNHSATFLIARETNNFTPAKGLYTSRCVADEWLNITKQMGKKVLIEKTPKHIHSVSRIRKVLPQAKVMVVVRNPLDNCFSLYERFSDLDYAIERWNIDNAKALEVLEKKNTKLIKYEDLTSEPEAIFSELCEFLNIEWEPTILLEGDTAYDSYDQLSNMSLRQKQVKRSILPNTGKWRLGFSESQINAVLNGTGDIANKLGYKGNPLAESDGA